MQSPLYRNLRRASSATLLCLLLALVALAAPAAADEAPRAPRIYVLTFGPGDHPFFKFGHNAIWVEPPSGGGQVYNFGTFAFDSPSLIPKFILGRFHYWLSVSSIEDTLWSYQSSNRTIEAQELNLTADEALALEARLRENARPENRSYLYDYFYDNCSTRVRDAVDAGLGGLLAQTLEGKPGSQTMRAHALRLTKDVHWEYVALHLALSGRTDFQPNLWQESFIPEVFQKALREVRVQRPSGTEPLVKREYVIFPAPGRERPAATPPARTSLFLLAGLLCAGVLFATTRAGHRSRAARTLLGLGLAMWGLLVGIVGGFLLFVWLFTNHVTSQANENILQAPFFMLALTVVGLGVVAGRPGALLWAQRLFSAALATSGLGLVLKLLPGFDQRNTEFILFFLPIWLSGAIGLRELRAAFVWRAKLSKVPRGSTASPAAR